MNEPARVYFDNAATSWPKPEAVYDAVDAYQRHCGAPAGRSTYGAAVEAQRRVAETRRALAELIGTPDASRIVFTLNGTDSLNLALHGLLREGDHVVTSVAEHNSVLRPLRFLEERIGITVTRVPCDALGRIDPDAVRSALQANTRLLALTHASNVTGVVQPIADIGALVREHGALMLVDAAQTLGHFPMHVDALKCDLLAAPGHKGLLGPLGTGVLYIGPRAEPLLSSVRQGGTGTRSEDDRQPESLPDKFEPGNLNMPGVVGLGAGVAWLREQGLDQLHAAEKLLTRCLIEQLQAVPSVKLYAADERLDRVGVVSLTVDGYDPQELAALLDATCGVQARAGLHCAPLMHQALGTAAQGGTLRFSLGPFNTREQIALAAQAIQEITCE